MVATTLLRQCRRWPLRWGLWLLAMLWTAGAWAQAGITVTGRVSSAEENQPMAGVTVIEKGSGNGVFTNTEGRYEIKVAADAVLLFKMVGHAQQAVAVQGRSQLDVSLVSNLEVEEVVIVGFAEQKKVTVTGAVSSISTEELDESPAANVANALAGKVTGLASIQASGQPGADNPQLLLRGVGSLTEGASSPLILVDGVVRDFNQLDPSEIESISVLKDASATAVYGVRGANGVILVTTKRGKKGPANISASVSTGLQQPTRLLEIADSYTYATLFNEAQLNDGAAPGELRFSPFAIEAFRSGRYPELFPNTDWINTLMKPTAMQSRGNVNIRGGSERVRYFVAASFLSQDGFFRNFDQDYPGNFTFERYNFRTNLDIDLSPTTRLSLTNGGRIEDRNRPQTVEDFGSLWRDIYWSVPFSGPGIVDGRYIKTSNFYIPGEKKDGLTQTYGQGFRNSVNSVLNLDLELNQQLDFITKGLKFRTKFSYNTSFAQIKNRSSSTAFYEPFFRTDVDPEAVGDSSIVYRRVGNDGDLNYSESYNRARHWYMEAGLEYKRSFDRHNVTGLLLYNQDKRFYPGQFTDIPLGFVGLAARATYNYNARYLLDLNLGYNGSENFAEGRRFGLFPAISAGWVISNEAFLENSRLISLLKVRASYGLVGNDQLGGNRFLYLPDSYSLPGGGYSFGVDVPQDQLIAREGRVGNPLVTWEKARKINLGLDLGLWEDKLSLSLDFFDQYRENILTTRNTVPAFVAVDLPAVNIGIVENRGFELAINWTETRGNWQYWARPNVSFAKNNIVFTDEVPPNEPYLARTGRPVNQPFGYLFDGFVTAADTMADSGMPDHLIPLAPGDLKYKDLNGDGIIDPDDQTAIGFPNYPQFVFGGAFGFSVGNFDLNTSWAGATNVSRVLTSTPWRVAFGPTNTRGLLQWQADGRWTPETADEAYFPRMTLANGDNNYKDSDFWLRDASYLRLKTAEVGYRFSPGLLARWGIKSLRVYMNGFNLLTFDTLKIADPEANTVRETDYPVQKIYNLGLNVVFN